MKTIRFLGCGMLTLLFVACGNPDLSRGKAQSLIQKSEEFSKPQEAAKLTSAAGADGLSQGFWETKGIFTHLTPKGQEIFSGFRYKGIEVRQALSREVTAVTGVADAVSPIAGATRGLKEAHFKWEYSNVTGPVRRFIVRGGTGVALVRLYDDGWRIEELDIEEGTEGFVLTPAEKAAAEKDKQAELVRRQAEQERLAKEAERKRQERQERRAEQERKRQERRAEQERKRQEKLRRDRRIAESKQINRVIGSFACLDRSTGENRPGRKITLTDVSVKYKCPIYGDHWYGNIKRYQSTSCKVELMSNPKPCVMLTDHILSMELLFADDAKRDAFHKELSSAIANWRKKYPDLSSPQIAARVSRVTKTEESPSIDEAKIQSLAIKLDAKVGPSSLVSYRGQNGRSFYFIVRGTRAGNIYGTDVYTDDSLLAKAAVHAGVLQDGEKGIVKVTILPGQGHYQKSTRNGVTSLSWSKHHDGSYKVEKIAPDEETETEALQNSFFTDLKAKITEVRFFERGKDMPPRDARKYQKRFTRSGTKYINWELNLAHPPPGRRVEFDVTYIYYNPSGSVLGRHTHNTHVEANWTWSYHTNGWGWEKAGNWSPGSYRVEFYVAGKKIAEEVFTVLDS